MGDVSGAAWDGINVLFLGTPDEVVQGTKNGWADFKKKFFDEPDSSGPDSGVKGTPAPDGGVPKTKGFFDKIGDAILNASQGPSTTESLKDTVKWIAIAIAAAGAVYVIFKVV